MDWQHPCLRINLLLREMIRLGGHREMRPALKVDLNKAIAMREQMRRDGRGWS